MGIVKKQAFINTVVSYGGVALGALNAMLLYPRFFSTEEIGLVRLLVTISTLFTQFSVLGLNHAGIRFFPYYKEAPDRRGGFGSWIVVLTLLGFALVSLAYVFFREAIVAKYQENSPLYVEYYYVLLPLSFVVLFMNLFDSLAAATLTTVFPAFVREVAIRAATTGLIIVYAYGKINFPTFIYSYTLIHTAAALAIILLVLYEKKFTFSFNFKEIKLKEIKEILTYGFYSSLSSGSNLLVSNIDGLMIAAMVGLNVVGIYGTYMFMAIVVSIPARSFIRITRGLIANSWQKGDFAHIEMIYKQTALVQFILGIWIFIGIWANHANIQILLQKPEFAPYFPIFIFLGVSYLAESAFGLNHQIIATSDKYQYDFIFNLCLVALSFVSNYFFIKAWGGVGAAAATALSVFSMNALKWAFVRYHFKMDPFSWGHLKAIIVGAACLGLGLWLPRAPFHFILDILYRSATITIIYFAALWVWRASEQLNAMVEKNIRIVWQKL